MYTFGRGDAGQQGTTSHYVPSPTPLSLPHPMSAPIALLSCGWGHGVAVEPSRVWAWGSNKHGQCGVGKKSEFELPQIILEGKQFKSVACGSVSNLFDDNDGRLNYIYQYILFLPK